MEIDLGSALPRFATQPTPGAANELEQCVKVAAALGIKLMPWQRLFIRVATELKDDGTYRYPTVVLSTPRQCGKSTTLQLIAVTRSLIYPPHKTYFTAQDLKSAYDHICIQLPQLLGRSVLKKKVKTYLGAMAPAVKFPGGSLIAPFTPSADGLHGKSSVALVILDEIFAYSEEQGSAVLGAVQPTQLVAKRKQIILTSTKGTATDSTWLDSWLENGRESLNDPDADLCFFEWSMAPELDPFDMGNFGFHPALGHTITIDDIRNLSQTLSKGEFRRAVANQPTLTKESLFDMKGWRETRGEVSIPQRRDVAIGFEVARDRSSAAVVASWRDENRRINVKVLKNGAGTAWLPGFLLELDDLRPQTIGCDAYAQNLVIVDELASMRPDIEIYTLKPMSLKTGSASLKAHLEDRTIRHEGNPALTTSIREAESRPMGDGWALKHSRTPEAFAMLSAVRQTEEVKAESKPSVHF
ncbi:hypothetical protein F7P69_00760 [Cellulosimicrobium funkei]|nr:hypothetical protein [Cellulosimicrobium funkei]